MSEEDTITVIVPAFNEEGNVTPAVGEIVQAVEGDFEDYEIIIFDDGSSDGTGGEADRIAAANPKVRVVHNPANRGLGWNYKTGVGMARMTRVTWVPGKHDIEAGQLRKIFAERGKADMVVPYHINKGERPWFRRIASHAYTWLLNVLFWRRMRCWNESVLYRTELVRSFVIRTDSYAFQAETLIKAIKSGCSYVEVPIRNLYPPGLKKTSAFRLKNLWGVAGFLVRTLYDVYIGRNYRRA
jgi:glycosyltransferase involved in cell wall biosynthesis